MGVDKEGKLIKYTLIREEIKTFMENDVEDIAKRAAKKLETRGSKSPKEVESVLPVADETVEAYLKSLESVSGNGKQLSVIQELAREKFETKPSEFQTYSQVMKIRFTEPGDFRTMRDGS